MSIINNLTDLWTNSGVTYTAIKMNVTDTASAAGSLLMDLQVGSTSKFSVSKAGLASGVALSFGPNGTATTATLYGRTSGTGASGVLRLVGQSFNGQHLLDFILPNSSDPSLYFNDGGHFFSRLSATVSGHYTGSGNAYNISEPTTDPYMIGSWLDVNGPAFVAKLNTGAQAGSQGWFFGAIDATGNHVFNILDDGDLVWGVGTRAQFETRFGRDDANTLHIKNYADDAFRDLKCRSIIQSLPASVTPASNGDMVVEATANTTLTFKLKGSDGTVRSGTITLS